MAKLFFDLVLLTQKDYVNPSQITPYISNVLLEDALLSKALEIKGLKVTRTFWDNVDFDWSSARFALFRATWDYFHRFSEFNLWLERRKNQTRFINPYSIIQWNMDKHYLRDLQERNINIPPTLFLEKNQSLELDELLKQSGWHQAILKPAIAGGARHTYFLNELNVAEHQMLFQQLIRRESMLLQEFQYSILSKGEVSFILFAGKYSHAILKKTKAGDFRVQDDFGGSVQPYQASLDEIEFAEQVIACCDDFPVYARVDVMWDNQGKLCVSELEMFEPELWFRTKENAADLMANAVVEYIRAC